MKNINIMKNKIFYFLLLFTVNTTAQTVNYDVIVRGDSTFLITTSIENSNKNVNETYIPDVNLLQQNIQLRIDSIFMKECEVVKEVKLMRDNLQNLPPLIMILNKLNNSDNINNQSNNLLSLMSGEAYLFDSTFTVVDTLNITNQEIISQKQDKLNCIVYYYSKDLNLGKLSITYNNTPLTFYVFTKVNESEIWMDLNSSYYLVRKI